MTDEVHSSREGGMLARLDRLAQRRRQAREDDGAPSGKAGDRTPHDERPDDGMARLALALRSRRGRQSHEGGLPPDSDTSLRVVDDTGAIANLLRNPDRIDGASGVVGLTD